MTEEQTQLLAMMQQDPAAARQLFEASLAEQSASNPALAMMMQLMAARPGAGQSGSEPGDDVAPSTKRQRVERMRAHLHELRASLDSAHGLLDDLAAALGACAACWGGEDACPACRGRGAPGWRTPDAELYDELVAPAVKRRTRPNLTHGRTE